METWKAIDGFEEYEISDMGNIRSNKRKPGPLRWYHNPSGYLFAKLWKDGKHHCKLGHRLVMAAFSGKSDLEVNHKDMDKHNNRLDNLEYTDRSGNMRHAFMGRVRGVVYHKKRNSYQARMQVDCRTRHLGWFKTYEEAAKSFMENFKNQYGEYPYLNNENGDLL